MRKAICESSVRLLGICSLCAIASPLCAQNNGDERPQRAADETIVREAATRSIRLIEQSSARSLKERTCVSCHHQTMSLMLFGAAQKTGLEIDKENSRRQLARALDFYNSRREGLLSGELKHQAIPVGYGLWGLDLGGHKPDDLTEALTTYLLDYQKGLGHWKRGHYRPPAESSSFTANYVAIRGLNRYGTKEQKEQITARATAVKRWLAATPAGDTEDQVFRLRLAYELEMAPERRHKFAENLLMEQHDDGGWAQKPGMKADAYATGSVLVTLHDVGEATRDDPAWRRGIHYLLQTQKADGSWHVESRSDPLQVHFESGFPHGADQFISAYATGWASTALLLSLPAK